MVRLPDLKNKQLTSLNALLNRARARKSSRAGWRDVWVGGGGSGRENLHRRRRRGYTPGRDGNAITQCIDSDVASRETIFGERRGVHL